MEGIIGFAFILVLGFIAVVLILPFVALSRAGRAARKAEQSEKNEKELGARLSTLEQQVIKLANLVSRVEDLERQIQSFNEPARATVSEPAGAPLQFTPAQPSMEIPEPPPAAAYRDRPEIGEAPGIVPLVPPPPPPPPVVHAPHGVTRLDKALHAELPPPHTGILANGAAPPSVKEGLKEKQHGSAEVPAPVKVPPATQAPLPPVEIPPQRATPGPPPKPAVEKTPPVVVSPAPTPKPEAHGHAVPPRPTPVARPLPPPPVFVPRPPGPSLGDRMRRLMNIEEVLGANYLGKLGVIILVIGVAGLVGYKFSSFPAWLQFLSAYLIGLMMLVAGVRFEGGRYRLLARAGIGGGWASIFVTTWALHHAGKAPVVASETFDLILMLLVAAGMVAHTLKYNSQVVSGLAFLLPSLTVTVTLYFATDVADAIRIPSLVASAILAAGLVVIVVRRHWFELEVFGIASTFVNHFLWIRPVVERHQGFPEYYASAALLVTYWVVFRASYIVRKIEDAREEAVSTAAALLNTILLLGVLKYQALHPEMAFYFLLALGAAELALGQLPATHKRRTAFVILTTLGATFLLAGPVYKLSGAALPVVWLAEAEAFFLAGVFTREIVFRRLGMIAGLIVAAKMDWLALAQVTDPKFTGLQGEDILKASVVYGTAALVFYANSHAAPRRWPDLVKTSLEDWSFRGFSYIAGSIIFLGLWLVCAEVWTAVAWGGIAFLLAFIGAQLKIKQLSTQVPVFAAAAVLRVFTVNYYATGSIQHVSTRLITVVLVAGLLFAASRWMRRSEIPVAQIIAEAHTWAATALVAVLIWHESPELWRAACWATMAMTLSLLGRHFKLREFSHKAHCLAAAAFAGCFVFDLITTVPHHHHGARLTVVLLTSGFVYFSSRQLRLTQIPSQELLAAVHTWTASTLLMLLAWYEVRVEYAAPAWILLGFALVTIGRALKLKRLSYQGLLLSVIAFVGVLIISFAEPSSHTHDLLRLGPVALVAALLYASSRWAGLLEAAEARTLGATQTWGATFLLALLAWYEVRAEYAAPAWITLGLAMAIVGRALKLKRFSFQEYALAFAAFLGALLVNMIGTSHHTHIMLRLATVSFVAAMLYVCSRWAALVHFEGAKPVAEMHTWWGTALVALLAWYELPTPWTAVAWAALALILVFLGQRIKFKDLSYQGFVLSAAAFIGGLTLNLFDTPEHVHVPERLLTVALIGGMIYFASLWTERTEIDGANYIAAGQTWQGTFLFAVLAWYELRTEYVAPVWCGMALALIIIGSQLKRRGLSTQGYMLSIAGLSSVFAVNFYGATLGRFDSSLLVTVGLSAALLYSCSRWSASMETAKKMKVPEAYTWAGSTLVFFLIWYELQPVGVAVGWALFGIMLFELGFGRRSASLRFQAYVAFTASFARSLYVNFNTAGNHGEISLRVWTTVFLALVFFYAFGRLVGHNEEFLSRDRTFRVTQLFGYLGSITVAALLRSELDPNWVIAGWALMIVVFVGVAWRLEFRIFLDQGLLLSFAVLYRTALFNFYQSSHIPTPSEHSRLVYVGVAASLLLLSVPLALQVQIPESAEPKKEKQGIAKFIAAIMERPEQVLFFIPYSLLTVVFWLELPNAATLSWGLEAVIIFLFALWAGQRSFRLAAVALLLACVVRIALVDFWKFNGSYRWLTAMGLGVALIVVSFLYTRYHEAIRRYL